MQKLFIFLMLFFAILSCSKDSKSKNTDFEFTVSGAAQATVEGSDCRFGSSSGSNSFITMNSGDNDILTLRIALQDLVPGTYLVNAGFVNGMFQPNNPGDSKGELQLGSIFTGNKFYNTSGGDGGSVTITSVDGEILRGNFQVSMLELIGGTAGTEPKINVAGDFVAEMQ